MLLCSNSVVLQHETRREFEVPNLDRAANERITKFARRVKQKVITQQAQDIEVKQWEEKRLHGRYPKGIREADVDDYKTNQWLRSTGLKVETRGTNICSPGPEPPHRVLFCKDCEGRHQSIVQHMPQALRNSRSHHIWLSELAKTYYLERHNKAAAYIH